MHSRFPLLGVGLIAFGVIYIIKPDIFQRWFWKRTAISQQIMSPESNKTYMRVLGAIFIIVGLLLVLLGGSTG